MLAPLRDRSAAKSDNVFRDLALARIIAPFGWHIEFLVNLDVAPREIGQGEVDAVGQDVGVDLVRDRLADRRGRQERARRTEDPLVLETAPARQEHPLAGLERDIIVFSPGVQRRRSTSTSAATMADADASPRYFRKERRSTGSPYHCA